MNNKDEKRVNHQIRCKTVRLVGENIPNSGEVYSIQEAMNLANELELDLVEISSDANPPVAKIVDYKKFIYDSNKKKKDLEKKQKKSNKTQKSVEFTVNIAENDLSVKENNIKKFIINGHEVKIKVKFKGRELGLTSTTDRGNLILCGIADNLSDIAIANDVPKLTGRDMLMILRPKK